MRWRVVSNNRYSECSTLAQARKVQRVSGGEIQIYWDGGWCNYWGLKACVSRPNVALMYSPMIDESEISDDLLPGEEVEEEGEL